MYELDDNKCNILYIKYCFIPVMKSDGTNRLRKCGRCTYLHGVGKCLAYGQKCNKCGRINHFAMACRNKLIFTLLET